jgi:creatinine amidohydrolase
MGLIDSALASSPDIARAKGAGLVAVLPIGAVEQHGPHLPLLTDTILATGVARRIANAIGAWLLPAIAYGDAWTAEGWAGTLSITPPTLSATIEDVGRGVQRIGIGGLLTINGHFGNRGPIARATEALIASGLPVLALDYPGLEAAAEEYCSSKPAGPGFYHADEVETSMMLALAPESVRMDLAVAEYPDFPVDFGARPMQLSTFNSSGVFGDPRGATAATGEKIIARIVSESLSQIAKWREGFA